MKTKKKHNYVLGITVDECGRKNVYKAYQAGKDANSTNPDGPSFETIKRLQREYENRQNRYSANGFTLGDHVRITGCTGTKHLFEIGTVGIVEQIDEDGYCKVVVPLCTWWQWVSPCDIEHWEE